MSALFEPMQLRNLVIPNRLWVSPMCQYKAVDGIVGDWHLMHLGALATGGAGLIIAEATAVSPEGRISVACPGLWNDDQVAAWSRVVTFAHSQGALVGVQLAHAGRKASTLQPWADHHFAGAEEGGWQAVAPSAEPFTGYPIPRALTAPEIEEIVAQFAQAARRAVAAGFDVLEIHAAHGYLLHEFLSPLSNFRTDAYGGSLENRMRLLLEVAAAVRKETDAPLLVRISATDWTEGGWDLASSVVLATRLRDIGVDLIDVSTGGNVANAEIPVAPGYQVPFAEVIRRDADIAVSAVGLITEPQQAEDLVAQTPIDAVMVARAVMRNPRWPLEAAESLGVVIPWIAPLERARRIR